MAAPTPAQGGTRQTQTRTLVQNRPARNMYFIEDTLTAGLVLEGWEVKAILAGQATFNGGAAFVKLRDGEAFLHSLTITPLVQARKGLLEELQPQRERKLLLNRTELTKLTRRVAQRGYTVVPLALTYAGKVKLEIGVARGKLLADKRETVKARDLERETARQLRER